MPSTTVLLENIERTTQATLDALNAWDYDALASHHTDDWVFQRLPHSLNLPPLDNEQYRELWVNFLTPAFKNFKISPRTTTHDPSALRSVVYADVSAQTPGGPRSWELVSMMSFDETGQKLVRLDEFFDSKVFLDMTAGGRGGGK